MKSRFTLLSFIIGLFFLIVALILVVGYFVSSLLSAAINLYAGILFFLFGIFMVMIKENTHPE